MRVGLTRGIGTVVATHTAISTDSAVIHCRRNGKPSSSVAHVAGGIGRDMRR